MSENRYFENIGMWPRGGRSLGYAYLVGFGLSLGLTLVMYALADSRALPPRVLVPALLLLAFAQFVAQLHNFLHVRAERSSRERLAALVCTGAIVLILVVGSMWIMGNLNARMMPDAAHMETYMQKEQGI